MTPDPTPPIIYRTRPSGDWGTALVFACFAIGLILSWGTYEMRQRIAQEESTRRFRHDIDAVTSRQRDLGRLLADPRTKLIRLLPTGQNSLPVWAAVAWNDQSQTGALFSDDLFLRGSRRYQLQLVPSSGLATSMLVGPSAPGQTVYFFNPAPGNSASPDQIILNDWNDLQPPGQLGPELARGKVNSED
jgi:hypothetical protein